MKNNDKLLFPKRVTIETIFGCNCKCLMCPIDFPTERKKGVMPLDMFKDIVDSLTPYKDKLEMMDFCGLGEPLLDPHIFERIKYVKDKGFRNLGMSTNANLMDDEKQDLLLESGIDTLIFSIDGIKKETHEKIRRGAKFDLVVANCLSIIQKRNKGNYKTRFVIRFIRQDINKIEWLDFKEYWLKNIDKERRDFVTAFDMHSWGGEVSAKSDVLKVNGRNEIIEKKPCPTISNILYILSDGTVPLCNEDWLNATYSFGNVKEKPPIEVFNCDKFRKIRELHEKGNKREMKICSECTVLYSFEKKEIV